MDPNPSPGESLNVAGGSRIPGRGARIALVVVVAAAAGLVTGGAVLVTRDGGGGGDGGGAAAARKPLKGTPPLVIDVKPAALRRLPAEDLRRRVAAIIRRDDEGRRAQSIAALQALPQDEPVVGMALGLAQLWAGDVTAAGATLERVKKLDPYGYYGTNADNLLHLSEAPGYPPWLTTARPAGVSLAHLRARTEARPGDPDAWLALAAGLENRDRLGAISAAKRAFALDPGDVSARIAVTILPFDKDTPGDALSGLMRILQSSPSDDAEVRVHVGLVFFWMRDEEDAAAQFRQVLNDDPKSVYGQVAGVFTRCIDNLDSCRATTGSDPNVAP
jgi:tetratricopeptide (TPR) repeat protein